MVLWVLTLCRLAGRYQHFEETFCHHLQGCKSTQHHTQPRIRRLSWEPQISDMFVSSLGQIAE